MDINTDIDINSGDKEILFTLIAKYLPDTSIWAYGSRVSGGSKPWSDLDLVVFTGAEQKYMLSLLREALEESNLSCRTQLLEWNFLPENFKTNIEASHVVIQH
jgi:type I restriction enzyme S subunit